MTLSSTSEAEFDVMTVQGIPIISFSVGQLVSGVLFIVGIEIIGPRLSDKRAERR